MKTLFVTIFLSSCYLFITAQQITNWKYILEPINHPNFIFYTKQESISTLKLVNPNNYQQIDFLLTLTLRDAALNGRFQCFKDDNQQKAFNQKELFDICFPLVIDTVAGYDFEKDISSTIKGFKVFEERFPGNITSYQVNQSWSWNKKRHQLTTSINQIGFVFKDYSKTYAQQVDTIFIPFNTIKKNAIAARRSKSIWAKQIVYLGSLNKELRIKLMSDASLDKHPLILKENVQSKAIDYSYYRFLDIDNTKDTIITLSKSNALAYFKEKKDTTYGIERDFPAIEIADLEYWYIVQNWYFNPLTMVFDAKIIAIGPAQNRYEKEEYDNAFLNHQPTFWIVYDKHFLDFTKD